MTKFERKIESQYDRHVRGVLHSVTTAVVIGKGIEEAVETALLYYTAEAVAQAIRLGEQICAKEEV